MSIRILIALALLAAVGVACAAPALPTASPATNSPPSRVTIASPTGAAPSSAAAPATAQDAGPCDPGPTRTPPPGAPTFVPGGPNPPRGPVDPHIEICATATRVRVGDTVTVYGRVIDIGLPYYMIFLKNPGEQDFGQLAGVTYDNRLRAPMLKPIVFEFVTAEGDMRHVTTVLRAIQPGEVAIRITATGEIHYGYPGPATNAGGGSEPITIIVSGK